MEVTETVLRKIANDLHTPTQLGTTSDVLVIHPSWSRALTDILRNEYNDAIGDNPDGLILHRIIFFDDRAPQDKCERMSEDEYERRYPIVREGEIKKTNPSYCDFFELEGSECTFDRDGREYIYDVWVCPKCGEEYISNIRYVE